MLEGPFVLCLNIGIRAPLLLAALICPLLRPHALRGHSADKRSRRDPENLPPSTTLPTLARIPSLLHGCCCDGSLSVERFLY